MAFQKGQGGRRPGSKNKLTLAKATAFNEAMKRMNDELGDKGFKGDAIEFLQWIYKNPDFDLVTRMDAAKNAAAFERPKKSETTIEDKRETVVRMPTMPTGETVREQLDNWIKQHGEGA